MALLLMGGLPVLRVRDARRPRKHPGGPASGDHRAPIADFRLMMTDYDYTGEVVW